MPTYEAIVERFKEEGCELKTTREKYEEMKDHMKSKFDFKATCGHENTVTLTNFWYKGTGKVCKECTRKKVGENAAAKNVQYNLQEYNGILKIVNVIEHEFDVIKTNEGCMADILVKPKYMANDDKWMLVQIKTTSGICHNLYTFSISKRNYENCYIICICLKDDKIWIVDNTQVIGKDNLNIGTTSKSEYYGNMVSMTNLLEHMHYNYGIFKKFNKEYGMLPLSIEQQQEQKYRRLRENMIPFLHFVYPAIEAQRYDFHVKNYKIQEKVASIAKKNTKRPLFIVNLYKNKKQN